MNIITSNGEQKEVTSFVPENSNELAVVDLNVLKKITSYLPKANFNEIKHEASFQINKTENIKQMVDFMKSEVAFHETVNLIISYEAVKPVVNSID